MNESSSSSKRAEEFDPYAFAERWYEENPWAWESYSQALARLVREDLGEIRDRFVRIDSVRGRNLMEDEQIVEEAKRFGKEVRELEDQGLEEERTQKRREWAEFRSKFKGAQRTLAVESYYIEYCQQRARGEAVIIPIVKNIKGEDQTIGTVRVLPDSNEVEFYLKPGFSMAESVMKELTQQLKKLSRRTTWTENVSITKDQTR